MKVLCPALLLLLLSACTSLEDFHNMSADERAQKVCAGSKNYEVRARSLRQLNDQIDVKEELLTLGYRVYEQCQIVSVAVPGSTIDCGEATGKALKRCQKEFASANTQRVNVCTETAIPIDYEYESSALRDLQMTKEGLREQHEQSTYVCEAKIRSMPADRAYSLYKEDMED